MEAYARVKLYDQIYNGLLEQEEKAKERKRQSIKRAYDSTSKVLGDLKDRIAKPVASTGWQALKAVGRGLKKVGRGIANATSYAIQTYSDAQSYMDMEDKVLGEQNSSRGVNSRLETEAEKAEQELDTKKRQFRQSRAQARATYRQARKEARATSRQEQKVENAEYRQEDQQARAKLRAVKECKQEVRSQYPEINRIMDEETDKLNSDRETAYEQARAQRQKDHKQKNAKRKANSEDQIRSARQAYRRQVQEQRAPVEEARTAYDEARSRKKGIFKRLVLDYTHMARDYRELKNITDRAREKGIEITPLQLYALFRGYPEKFSQYGKPKDKKKPMFEVPLQNPFTGETFKQDVEEEIIDAEGKKTKQNVKKDIKMPINDLKDFEVLKSWFEFCINAQIMREDRKNNPFGSFFSGMSGMKGMDPMSMFFFSQMFRNMQNAQPAA